MTLKQKNRGMISKKKKINFKQNQGNREFSKVYIGRNKLENL